MDAPKVPVGLQTTARAIPVDRYGGAMEPAPARWQVTRGADVASVSEAGVITALAAGTAVVAATVDSITASASVDVLPADESQRGVQRPSLPQVYLDFPYPPVTGRSIVVEAGDNLQSALNRAQRGDEVVLASGATFTGNYVLPAKPGSAANGWIVVRSEGSGGLPPVGTRVVPSHAPDMARVVTPNVEPAIRTAPSASGWRLVGLEVTAAPSLDGLQYGLVWFGEAGRPQTTLATVPSDLVLDRMYIHGQPSTNLSRCVALNSARSQVSDSHIAECHARGFDSQAIWGGNGPGPFRISNNRIEGAAENIMFGGSDPAIPGLVPSDIEISRNHIVTPIAWKGVWLKKNLFELKNASRVLLEGNVLEGSWRDGQTGYAVVLKSANQSGSCRWCRTTDVTIRYNLVRNVGAGINISGHGDNPAVDSLARRILIHDTVVEDVGAGPYDGDGRGFQLIGGCVDVTIERTVLSGRIQAALMLDNRNPVRGSVFRDNIWAYGQYGAIASGASPGSRSLTIGAPGAIWQRMHFVGPQRGPYPPGTGFVGRERDVFTSYRIRTAVDSATSGVASP
jgi:hypothetical protein